MRNAAGGWSTPAASSGQTNERYTGRVTRMGQAAVDMLGLGRSAGGGAQSRPRSRGPECYNNNDHNTIILRANSDTARRSVVSGASVRAVLLRGSVVSGASVRARS
eukprot:9245059-Pyramimonas_sp.AAC.4